MKKFMFLIALGIMGLSSCKSSKTVTDNTSNANKGAVEQRTSQRPNAGQRGGQRPGGRDRGEMFTRMDANGDGKLSKTEVKGPFADKFGEIDTDNNGFISKEEMEKAPRPQRGQRGQRPNRGGGK